MPVYKDNGGITPPGNRTGTVYRRVNAMASTLGGAGPTLLCFARGTLRIIELSYARVSLIDGEL